MTLFAWRSRPTRSKRPAKMVRSVSFGGGVMAFAVDLKQWPMFFSQSPARGFQNRNEAEGSPAAADDRHVAKKCLRLAAFLLDSSSYAARCGCYCGITQCGLTT